MNHGARTPVGDPISQLIRSVRFRWRGRESTVGVLRAIAGCAAVVAVLLVLDLFPVLTPNTRAVLRWLPLLVAAGVAMAAVRKARGLGTDRETALWMEEQGADPDHLLVTALEADLTSPLGRAVERRAEKRARAMSATTLVPWSVGHPMGRAAAMLAVALLATLALPGGLEGVWERWIHLEGSESVTSPDAAGATTVGDGVDAVPAFSDLGLTLTPPAYTGLPVRAAAPDAVVRALPGTAVEMRVNRSSGVVEATRIGVGPLRLGTEDSSVTARWLVSPSDRGVDLTLHTDDATGGSVIRDRRVVALSILEDRPPEVTLEQPGQDLVVAAATGTVSIRAQTTDDFGVGEWTLHWIHSSGSGESFSFEEGEWEWGEVSQRGDTTVGMLELDLATTGLGPGDVLHLRAEAQDRNDVTGPGLGVSATRQIRVVTDDQLDQVTTLIGFPIAREREPVLSQRMIILLTEQLLEEADGLTEEEYGERAAGIADEQDRLREGIEQVMFVREASPTDEHDDAEPAIPPGAGDTSAPVQTLDLPGHEHDGSPILGVDPDLLVAFNNMWEAGRRLRQNAVANSLPPQHVALEHLQKLREADRVFARGRVERPPLDLDAARGTGEVDDARPAPRSAAEANAETTHWRGEIESAVAGLDDAAGLANDELASLALRLQELAAAMLSESGESVEAANLVASAAGHLESENVAAARRSLADAARALGETRDSGRSVAVSGPTDPVEAQYLERLRATDSTTAEAGTMRAAGAVPPFVFATARYRSGDWDSAPLVPSNLIHSLAQYTSLPVEEKGVIVDLSSPDMLSYPFVFLTGHLPLRLDDAEATNLRRYVDRGGFIFIDDHNHDIDGAFHRSVLSELARVFGGDALQPLPESHELYRSFFTFDDGPPITGHELSGWGDGLIHEELFAIQRNGRIGVLYSNKDYASEWSYHAENKRFLALDNTRFGVNILLYALTR